MFINMIFFRLNPIENQEKCEVVQLNNLNFFDPFLERNLEYPTT